MLKQKPARIRIFFSSLALVLICSFVEARESVQPYDSEPEQFSTPPHSSRQSSTDTSDLAYRSYLNSNRRLKCLYGYVAEKTGDHEAAMMIFEDCIARWNDVYSMIWLAQMYESGVAVPQDIRKSTALMKRGAEQKNGAGYSRLARFHYGVALYEGMGTKQDQQRAVHYLERAATEGVKEACDYLEDQGEVCPQTNGPGPNQ